MKIKHDTILISDLHLGSPMCQAKELLVFLQSVEVKRFILNGDVFEDLKRTYRLTHSHWAIIEQLRKMSDHCEVIWVKGNHDTLYRNKKEDLMAISNLLGIKMKYELVFDINGVRILATHGDKWDGYLYKHPMLNSAVTWIYDRLKEINSKRSRALVKWVKLKSKLLMRNSQFVMNGAIRYAHELDTKIAICGHTHHAMLESKDGIIYGNCGTWESFVPTYITIDEDGVVGLWKYENSTSALIKREK